ncbi:MAG: vWA domain-containing protein, partial [Candidatus Asgardarchaeia archaeon]
MIRPEIPGSMPVSEVELLVFVMDGSGSMSETCTPDGRSKAEHLYDIVHGVLNRLMNSSKKDVFRISFVYFSDTIKVEEINNSCYFPIDIAISNLRNPLDVVGGGSTAIADALAKVNEIFDKFSEDEGIPEDKKATVFLFTDGQENIRGKDDVIQEAKKLLTYPLSPVIATISFGSDADESLLMEIASKPNDRQIRHLDISGVLSELPDTNKLYLQGHASDGTITRRKIEAIR